MAFDLKSLNDDLICLLPKTDFLPLDDALAEIFKKHNMERLGGASGRGWSSYSSYQRCPYLYKVTYIDKERGAPSAALEVGSAFHTFMALHYLWMLDDNLTLTPHQCREELLSVNIRAESIINAWRVYEAYSLNYEVDYLYPLGIEEFAQGDNGNTCRYDLIARVEDAQPGIVPGTYIVEHKSVSLTTKIQTPSGHILMGDIKVGDEVVDPDGGTAKVTGVHPQGLTDLYEIQLMNGVQVKCCSEHLWLARTISGAERVLPMKDILQTANSCWELPVINDQHQIEYVPIESIRFAPKAESQCISVDSKRNLYVVDDGLITHNTAARFTADLLEGWHNDGEVLGQIMVWKQAKLDKKYGKLRGTIVNIAGKQKIPQFRRVIVPAQAWHVKQHTEDLKVWAALQELSRATNTWPRARNNCVSKFGLCQLFSSCAANEKLTPAQKIRNEIQAAVAASTERENAVAGATEKENAVADVTESSNGDLASSPELSDTVHSTNGVGDDHQHTNQSIGITTGLNDQEEQ